MAPEVWKDKPEPASDQYGLAVSYAESPGRRPFQADNYYTYMLAHLESEPDLEGMADAEKRVIPKVLARNARTATPAARSSSATWSGAVSGGSATLAVPPDLSAAPRAVEPAAVSDTGGLNDHAAPRSRT